MSSHAETKVLTWILSALIVAIATLAVVLGTPDGAQSAPAKAAGPAARTGPGHDARPAEQPAGE